MRRTASLVLLVTAATAATFAVVPAQAAEVEPPGTVLISTDLADNPNVSLSPGRITWNGASDGGQVLTRPLSSDGSTVTVGAQSTVGASGGWGILQNDSSGARTLFSQKYVGGGPRVVLADPSKSYTLAASGTPLRLSGNRALLRRTGDSFQVYDLRTGKVFDVSAKYATRKDPSAADLFGNTVVFLGKDLNLYAKNLSKSGGPVKIVKPRIPQGITVFAYGDWVAWDGYLDDGTGLPADYCGIRNIRTMAPATNFDCGSGQYHALQLRNLSSAGAIYRNDIDFSHFTWKLRRFNGSVTTLPVPTSTTKLQISGNVMAWVDADGLHAAPLPNPPSNRPRSLGNPVTKATYKIGGTSWPFRLVTTAAVTKCHVHITKAGVLVRQLDCSAGVLAAGEVQAKWDSRNSQGNLVGPGTYRWTAYASNEDGSMLRSDGAIKPTTGVLTVVR